MDDRWGLCMLDKCSDACFGTVQEDLVRARAQDEERWEIVRNEGLKSTSQCSRSRGYEVSRRPRETCALRVECGGDGTRGCSKSGDEIGGVGGRVAIAERSEVVE